MAIEIEILLYKIQMIPGGMATDKADSFSFVF